MSLRDTPDFFSARTPTSADLSLMQALGGHRRRSWIPVKNSSRPKGRLSLLYTGARRSSIWAEVSVSSGSRWATDSIQTFSNSIMLTGFQ